MPRSWDYLVTLFMSQSHPHDLLSGVFFQVPAGPAAREEIVAEMTGVETAAGAAVGRGLLLSSMGLRAGIQAPPELAQAVLEGVFWCR